MSQGGEIQTILTLGLRASLAVSDDRGVFSVPSCSQLEVRKRRTWWSQADSQLQQLGTQDRSGFQQDQQRSVHHMHATYKGDS